MKSKKIKLLEVRCQSLSDISSFKFTALERSYTSVLLEDVDLDQLIEGIAKDISFVDLMSAICKAYQPEERG